MQMQGHKTAVGKPSAARLTTPHFYRVLAMIRLIVSLIQSTLTALVGGSRT